MSDAISASQVRYIKLGKHGTWEKECLDTGIMRLGFYSENPVILRSCRKGAWDKLRQGFLDAGEIPGKATEFTNEIRYFFEDDGTTLWITFHGDRLFWCFLDPNPPECHADGVGTWRAVLNGWRCEDLKGEALTKRRLSKGLTKLAGYPGTICEVHLAEYVIRRINRGMTTHATAPQSTPTALGDDFIGPRTYPEGAVCQRTVNAYERNPKARQQCIDIHGTNCFICGFDFGRTYGPLPLVEFTFTIYANYPKSESGTRSTPRTIYGRSARTVTPSFTCARQRIALRR